MARRWRQRRPGALTAARWHDERGTGLIASIAGVTVFLALLFFATHLLVGLYFRSVVTALAHDAARLVAGSEGAEVDVQDHFGRLLGSYEGEVRISVTEGEDMVEVTVDAEAPRLLWPGLMESVGVERVTRTVRVRIEDYVDDPAAGP